MDIQQYGQKAYDFIVQPIAQDARINILEGSVRSGKTVAMIPKVLQLINSDLGKAIGVITGVSKDTIYDNVLRDLFDVVGIRNYNYNRQTGDLTLFGVKCKVIGAKDEGSEKYIRGKTIGWAYCDELSLMPETFFKQLLNRMSVKGAKLYGTTNPDSPYHYLYTDYITDEAKLASGMVKVWHFELEDNPNLDEEYLTFIRAAYAGLWYKRMIQGLWVLADGAIYDMFTETNQYKDGASDLDNGLWADRYFIVDYGTVNPFVVLEVAVQNRKYYVENEWYYDSRAHNWQKDDHEHVEDLKRFIGGRTYKAIIVDPSAASFKVAARSQGLRMLDANNDVLDGIRLVASLFSLGLMKVNKDKCPNFLKEVASYVWDEGATKRGEEKPIKQNDHLLDCARYFENTIVKRIMRGAA